MKKNNAFIGFAFSIIVLGPLMMFMFDPGSRKFFELGQIPGLASEIHRMHPYSEVYRLVQQEGGLHLERSFSVGAFLSENEAILPFDLRGELGFYQRLDVQVFSENVYVGWLRPFAKFDHSSSSSVYLDSLGGRQILHRLARPEPTAGFAEANFADDALGTVYWLYDETGDIFAAQKSVTEKISEAALGEL